MTEMALFFKQEVPVWVRRILAEAADKVTAKNSEPELNIDEIISQVERGASFLIIPFYEGEPVGVTRFMVGGDAKDGDFLHGSIGYVHRGLPAEMHTLGLTTADKIARQLGLKRIVFETRRLGWKRICKDFGYSFVDGEDGYTIFTKKLH